MKRIVTIFTFLVLASIPAAFAQSQNDKYIEVRGTAEKTVAPDKITLSITIDEGNYRNKSLSSLEKEMKQALSRLGIDIATKLKVSDMTSVFYKSRARNQDAVLSKSYTLELNDARTMGDVAEALDEKGISNIVISKVEYSKMDSLKLEMKAAAVRNAKENATAMVQAIGQELGKAFYIYEQESYSNGYQPRMMMVKSADMMTEEADALPDTEFQELKVSCKVIVRFAL